MNHSKKVNSIPTDRAYNATSHGVPVQADTATRELVELCVILFVCDRSLLVHLELFAKMRNPRSLFEEAKLRGIFEQVTSFFIFISCL